VLKVHGRERVGGLLRDAPEPDGKGSSWRETTDVLAWLDVSENPGSFDWQGGDQTIPIEGYRRLVSVRKGGHGQTRLPNGFLPDGREAWLGSEGLDLVLRTVKETDATEIGRISLSELETRILESGSDGTLRPTEAGEVFSGRIAGRKAAFWPRSLRISLAGDGRISLDWLDGFLMIR